jgi:hypothetical protein
VKTTPRFLIPLLCSLVLALPCNAQVSPTFRFQQSNSAATPKHIYAMDLNNDGIPDIIETGDAGFAISISKGDGTFYLPVRYGFPMNVSMRVAPGDFNGDLTLTCSPNSTTQLLFFAGSRMAPSTVRPTSSAAPQVFNIM